MDPQFTVPSEGIERGDQSLYDKGGSNLTRDGILQILNRGESVMLHGKLITQVEQLPGEAYFVKNEQDAETTMQKLQKQIAEIQAEMAKLAVSPITDVDAEPKPHKVKKEESNT